MPFLAFYAGLWTLQNFVRPLRCAAAWPWCRGWEEYGTGSCTLRGSGRGRPAHHGNVKVTHFLKGMVGNAGWKRGTWMSKQS